MQDPHLESFIPVKSGTMQPKRPFDEGVSRNLNINAQRTVEER
jgi:hypothetical protein